MIEPTCLIVDDEPELLGLLVRTLGEHHFRCLPASGLAEAKMAVEREDPDLVVADLALQDGSGLDLLKYVRAARPSVPVVIITGFPSIHVAEESLRLGAFDLIEKPFDVHSVVEVVNEAMATREQQLAVLRETLCVIDRPAAFVDRRQRVIATNTRWEQLVGHAGRSAQRGIDDYVAATSPGLISDLLSTSAAAESARARLDLVGAAGAVTVDLVAVPFRERREQPGGFVITAEPVLTSGQSPADAGALDPLTGCLSQRGFLEALDRLRLSALRRSLPLAILLIDVDDFRFINQSQGYDLGDQILQDLANEIRRVVRSEDLVGRYGGDEFVVALYEANADDASAAASRLCAARAGVTYNLGGVSLPVSLTIGVAECPAGYTLDNRGLLEQALAAVIWARQNHRGPVVRYTEGVTPLAGRPAVDQEEIERLTREFTLANEKLKAGYVESVQALVAAVEAKDPYTRRHSSSVAFYAERLACELKLPEPLQMSVRYAAELHDVGKIGIPDQILTKPGPLSPEELELVKQHPIIGANIVSQVSCMRREVPFIQHHHENWDGSGYPAGLKGAAIPLGARILRVADSLDALLSERSYKPAADWSQALAAIRDGSGTLYDPRVVAALEVLANSGLTQATAETVSASQTG